MTALGARLAIALTVALLAACAPRFAPPGLDDPAAPLLTETGYRTADGLTLPVRAWTPEGDPTAVVLALHGFNDYANAFRDIGPWLAGRGVAVWAIDQRGFGSGPWRGLWAGTEAMAADATAIARALKHRHPDAPLYLLGVSMGGAVAMVALTANDPPPVAGAVLVAPAVRGRAHMPWYQRWALAASFHTVPGWTVTGRGLKIKPSDNIEMLRRLGRDPLVIKETRIDTVWGLVNLMDAAYASAPALDTPVLYLYGTRDEVVPSAPTRAVVARLPDCGGDQTVALYDSGFHMLLRDLNGHDVWRDIAAWIADPSAPLPANENRRLVGNEAAAKDGWVCGG